MLKYLLTYIINSHFLVIATLFISLFNISFVPYGLLLSFLIWALKGKKSSDFRRKIIMFSPFILYMLIFLFVLIFTENKERGVKVFERQISFIIVPLIFFFTSWNEKKINRLKKSFISLSLLLIVISFVSLIMYWIANYDFVKTMDPFFLQWKLPHLMNYHHVYVSIALVISTIFTLEIFELSRHRVERLVCGTIIIILSMSIAYLSSRTIFFIQFIILFSWITKKAIKFDSKFLKHNKIFVIIISFFFVSLLFWGDSYLMNKMFNSLNDDRFFLWGEAWDKIKSNFFILGEGLGSVKKDIPQLMSEKIDDRIFYKGFDLHNVYLTYWYELGVIGVFSILFLFAFPFFYSKNLFAVFIIFLFFVSFMTETILYRISGVLLFLFSLCIQYVKYLKIE